MSSMAEMREYLDRAGRSPFAEWRQQLDVPARQKVTTAVYRLGLGNFSHVKGVGAGVLECKINFGPGYRVYFGQDGDRIVILLRGGTKKQQQRVIQTAAERWQDYKARKKRGE